MRSGSGSQQLGQHVLLLSWFTGEIPWPGFGESVIRYYVDAEINPSIEASIDEVHTFAFSFIDGSMHEFVNATHMLNTAYGQLP